MVEQAANQHLLLVYSIQSQKKWEALSNRYHSTIEDKQF
jgi:hypothetical protein